MNTTTDTLLQRPRRNRKSEALRSLAQENHLNVKQFVMPLFLLENESLKESISSMPGIFRYGIQEAFKEVESLLRSGIQTVALFPFIPDHYKNFCGEYATSQENFLLNAIASLKSEFPEVCLIVDVALDPYTDHGHDGLVDERGWVKNEETIEILQKMALHFAQAGADVVAPSDMMDHRVAAIRKTLDLNGFEEISILSYAAKYASSLYGPFREALGSGLKFGDKKGYQMNPANVKEAVREALLDEREGADMLLIKPGSIYLDVIKEVKDQVNIPVGAYHVSGEYSMVMAAEQKGWLDADKVFYETFLSMRRAGADFIISYAAKKVADLCI